MDTSVILPGVCFALAIGLSVYSAIDVHRNKHILQKNKIYWYNLVILCPIAGSIVYFIEKPIQIIIKKSPLGLKC